MFKYKMIFMRAKKSMGQNFLKSEKALNDIVSAPGISARTSVPVLKQRPGVPLLATVRPADHIEQSAR